MRNAALKYDTSVPQGPLAAPALRRWLHGRWALLFSHPDDFAAYGFESDRWLVHVQEAFAATDIRPLARRSAARSSLRSNRALRDDAGPGAAPAPHVRLHAA